ncbi:MAG: PAS domain S-box protein [Candidatus Omnitrophica bacterium]|nr:PAS domain S-box protein [Candidatus Omnitrophota bacterium]
MKIRNKLIISFLTVALSVFLVGYFSANKVQEILQDSIAKSAVILARETMDKIDRLVYVRAEELQIYFKNLRVTEIILKANQEFEKIENVKQFIKQKDKEWTAAEKGITTPFMQEIIDKELSKELKRILDFFQLKYGYPVFGEIFITNSYGTNIAQTGKTSDYYQADEEWWQTAKKDVLYIGDIKYDESAKINSMDVCIRIDDDKGNFLGVIKAVLNAQGIINILRNIEAYHTHNKHDHGSQQHHNSLHFDLINKDGRILFSTHKVGFFEKVNKEFLSNFYSKTGAHTHYFIGTHPDKKNEYEELFFHAHSQGDRDYKGHSWILILQYKIEEVFAPVVKLRSILLTVSFSVAILAVLIGLFVSYTIINPLTKLRKATIEIGKGKLNTRIEVNTKDEIGELAKSFDEMTRKLGNITFSRDYVDNIIANIADSLIVLSPEGKIKTVNRATLNLLSYDETELIEKNADFLFEEKLQFSRVQLEKLNKGGSLINYETIYKTKHGKHIPVLLSGAVLKDEHKNITNIVCIAKDITNRKKAEEKIEQAQAELKLSNEQLAANECALKNMLYDMRKAHEELRDKEKSLNITLANLESSNKQLKDAQSQLIQSEKLASLGQLSAGVAHEINNPLGFISNNIAILEEYVDSYSQVLQATNLLRKSVESRNIDKAVSVVEEIKGLEEKLNFGFILGDINSLVEQSKNGIMRIEKIVKDLKTFARKDEGQLDLNNIEEILDGVISIVWNEIKYAAELKKEYGGVPLIRCNAQKLGQVFINLLINAAQSIKGKGEIAIKTYTEGDYACVEIADTGCGIPKEHIDKIFDPFFTTKEVGKGTGLGLSIGYDIIKQHGGEMDVVSEPGVGTKFIVKIPKEIT